MGLKPKSVKPTDPRGNGSNRYQTTCNVCGFGIFDWQDRVWSTGRTLGLVHAWCTQPKAGA
jgi:hypothetical protein